MSSASSLAYPPSPAEENVLSQHGQVNDQTGGSRWPSASHGATCARLHLSALVLEAEVAVVAALGLREVAQLALPLAVLVVAGAPNVLALCDSRPLCAAR